VHFNQALHGKRLWWYGEDKGGWCTKIGRGTRGCSFWWSIRSAFDIWKMVLACLMWLVWKDSHTFEDMESSLDQLKALFVRTLFDWSWVWGFTQCSSVLEF